MRYSGQPRPQAAIILVRLPVVASFESSGGWMRPWRSASTLLGFMLLLQIATSTTSSASAADDVGPVARQVASEQATPPDGNNVIGLNVARLRKDRYIWAAAELVNANGGDWGYLTVVFTAAERDTAQGEVFLQELLDRCFEQHLQPIIRVSTRFDVETETWSRPEPDDAE